MAATELCHSLRKNDFFFHRTLLVFVIYMFSDMTHWCLPDTSYHSQSILITVIAMATMIVPNYAFVVNCETD